MPGPPSGTKYFARIGGQCTELTFLERRKDLVRDELLYFLAVPAGADGTAICPMSQQTAGARPTSGGADQLRFFILAVNKLNSFRSTPEAIHGKTADEAVGRWDGGLEPRLDDLVRALASSEVMPISEDRKAILLTEPEEGEAEEDPLRALLGPAPEEHPVLLAGPSQGPVGPAAPRRPPALGEGPVPMGPGAEQLRRTFGGPPSGLAEYAPAPRQPPLGSTSGPPGAQSGAAPSDILSLAARLGVGADDVLKLMARRSPEAEPPGVVWGREWDDRGDHERPDSRAYRPRLYTATTAMERLRKELLRDPEDIIAEFEHKLGSQMATTYGGNPALPRPKAYFEARCPLGQKHDLVHMLELMDQLYVDLALGQPKVAQARLALGFGVVEQAQLDGRWTPAWHMLHLPQPGFRQHTRDMGKMPTDATEGHGGLVNQARLEAATALGRELTARARPDQVRHPDRK